MYFYIYTGSTPTDRVPNCRQYYVPVLDIVQSDLHDQTPNQFSFILSWIDVEFNL